jgi:hypothetical protein
MKVSWIVAAAVAAAGWMAVPAQADSRYDYGYGYQRAQYTRSAGFDRGYRDGLKHGRKDGDKGRSFHVARDSDYRDADNGYHRDYGPKYEYSTGYRDGYQEGYRRGFAEYARGYYGRYPNDRYRNNGYYNNGYNRDDRYRDGYYDRDGRFHPYDDTIYEMPRRD